MNDSLQVRDALAELRIISLTLPDLIALPDPEAAVALNQRIALLDMVEEAAKVSYSQRMIIIREFEMRKLWQYLTDPLVGQTFSCLTAWLSSGFIGCRRTNMEAHRDAKDLADMDPGKLIDVPKGTIKVLRLVSTEVRNRPDVVAAARALPTDQFEEKIEAEHPSQHIEVRKPQRFNFGRSQWKDVGEWITLAIERGIAGTREEAVQWACVEALENALIDEKLGAEEVQA